MSRPVTIYAEMTPNPSTMKFVADIMLIEQGSVAEFLSIYDCKGHSSFAEALFNFPFVTGVFIANNFVTVYKNEAVDWGDIVSELREYIRTWIVENDVLVEKLPETKIHDVANPESEKIAVSAPVINTEMDQKIVDLINEYVQPAVEQDGGAIHFQSFDEENGKVTVVLKGSCSGCPSSTATLKGGVETLLKTHIPQISEVVALNG